ncbi:ABC transporter permease [Schleiferilactobacillus harbinensis]|jgi:ABC-2 type transport system permease protein|uniref:ABC transporter permease n=1 Tax=Schleiferilactobacillus harbinensis TaxID=304207 RepID=UPI00242AEBDC|nr:ABC transporter permease [Schleiferilactobacillus harbinensis]MCI1783986.1 ABC transporter permease [Schleiferilactobacillus harbinensis]MCI1850487.1 ABC transporter permease [Schleiferilactobacillus harbinensis]
MRIAGMIKRVLREMLRDKRTIALMFIAPLFILTLIYFLFQSNGTATATLAVRGVDSTLVSAVDTDHVTIKHDTSKQPADKVIRKHDYAGMLIQKGDKLTLTLANSDQTKSAVLKQSLQAAQIKLKTKAAASAIKREAAAIKKLQQALAAATRNPAVAAQTPAQPSQSKNYTVKTHYLYGSSDSTYFDTLLPIMMGFVVFFFVFLISGIALLKERTTGTLYRLLATPVKRGEIISGYLAGYGAFALVQTLLVVLYTIFVFKVQIIGSIWNVLLINILLAAVALTMGLFISTFASSEFQMMQFIPIVVIPQIFFSGIIPVSTMPNWLQAIAHIMPLYYGATSMSNVVEKGASLASIAPSLLILLVFVAGFLMLNLVTMRKYRNV